MMVAQVGLRSDTTTRTCWVPVRPNLRVGVSITLKNSDEPDRLWEVVAMSEPRDRAGIHDDWKVGGL